MTQNTVLRENSLGNLLKKHTLNINISKYMKNMVAKMCLRLQGQHIFTHICYTEAKLHIHSLQHHFFSEFFPLTPQPLTDR